ncbi:glycerate kinase [Georgenia halophila]|uniref:Glycerate kinase n=1 Tax=Georgenia halophila TaxID=620889 RepID=A0ABP8KUB8_9MICO
MSPRVVVAPDKFKGSLSATEVAARVAAGLRGERPAVDVDEVPVADGGEGTVEAALAAGFRPVRVTATGPLGEPVETRYAVGGEVAVVEMAAVTGLQMITPDGGTARRASSRGLGEVIAHALDHGAKTVVVGIGGSASTDGGAGMLAALGARLSGPDGDVPNGGEALRTLTRVDLGGLHPRLADAHLVLASDVDNPLLGPAGAAAVYGPQKGADPTTVDDLDAALATWVAALEPVRPEARRLAEEPGAGAAGGVGYGCLLLGAEFRPGVEVVLDLAGFDRRLEGADLVVTGEGSLDEQSLHGKTPVGVARAAAAHGIPVVAVCGRSTLDARRARDAGLQSVHALTDIEPDVARCVADAGNLLERLAARIAASL